MGLWNKVRGVFGKVTNWVKNKITGIRDVKDKILPAIEPYLPSGMKGVIDTGGKIIDGIDNFVNRR